MYEHEVPEGPAYQRVSAVYEAALAGAATPGEYAAREAAYRAALRAARKDGEGSLIAAAWYYLARLWASAHERDKACTAHMRRIAAENETFGPQHAELIGGWHDFAKFLVDAHEPALVECAMRVSLALGRLQGGAEDLAAVQRMLVALWSAGLYDRMFRWAPRVEGHREHEPLGQAYRCLAHAYGRVGRDDEARMAYEVCLGLLRPGDDNHDDAQLGYAETFVERAAAKVRLPARLLAELRDLVDGPNGLPEQLRAVDVLAAGGTAEDLPRIFIAVARSPANVRRTCTTLLRRGSRIEEIHKALRAVAARSSGELAGYDALARFELDHGKDARAALRVACAGDRAELAGQLALLLLDDGDAAGLDELRERHPTRAPMLRIVHATLEAERAPSDAAMLAVYRAYAAWAKPWAARLDEDGKPRA